MEEERKLIANRIQTPDGTILWSRHVHDYISYEDKNGETYMLDGGNEYIRTSVNKEEAKTLAVYDDAPYDEQRSVILRGTFSKEGFSIFVPLCYLSDEHILNIIRYNDEYGCNNDIYDRELNYRHEMDIYIPEHDYVEADEVARSITKQ